MYRYFTAKHTRRCVDVLQDLVHAYNHTYHSSIGMAPADVTPDKEDVVCARVCPIQTKLVDWKFKVGDKVRIAMKRRLFQKGYIGNWWKEIFVIASRIPTLSVT